MLGLLLINKPEGITSFGVVARIKRLTGEKRVGHTGTLDPMATGVLPVLIGRGTVLCSHLLSADKSYRARVQLGVMTDTLDITGKVLKTNTVTCSNEQILNVLEDFKGKQNQVPPMYSAIKKDGVRMYELARKGESAQIAPREIEVFSLTQTAPLDESGEFELETRVSKGTYIRSLVRDIGERLGYGATLSALTRTETAGFGIGECVELDKLTADNISDYILPCDRAVSHLPSVNITEKQAVRFSNGGQLDLERLKIKDYSNGQLYRVYSGEKFLGLGEIDTENKRLNIACLIF